MFLGQTTQYRTRMRPIVDADTVEYDSPDLQSNMDTTMAEALRLALDQELSRFAREQVLAILAQYRPWAVLTSVGTGYIVANVLLASSFCATHAAWLCMLPRSHRRGYTTRLFLCALGFIGAAYEVLAGRPCAVEYPYMCLAALALRTHAHEIVRSCASSLARVAGTVLVVASVCLQTRPALRIAPPPRLGLDDADDLRRLLVIYTVGNAITFCCLFGLCLSSLAFRCRPLLFTPFVVLAWTACVLAHTLEHTHASSVWEWALQPSAPYRCVVVVFDPLLASSVLREPRPKCRAWKTPPMLVRRAPEI